MGQATVGLAAVGATTTPADAQEPEEIVKDLLTHTIPGTLVVASMVAAIALLQTE